MNGESTNTKIGWIIFFSLLAGFAVWLFMEYIYLPSKTVTIKTRKNFNLVLLRLPNDHDPDVFGASFWDARHTLAKLTPCPSCRSEAISHEKFFHDYINRKTKKDMKYPDNFNEWVKKICEAKDSTAQKNA